MRLIDEQMEGTAILDAERFSKVSEELRPLATTHQTGVDNRRRIRGADGLRNGFSVQSRNWQISMFTTKHNDRKTTTLASRRGFQASPNTSWIDDADTRLLFQKRLNVSLGRIGFSTPVSCRSRCEMGRWTLDL